MVEVFGCSWLYIVEVEDVFERHVLLSTMGLPSKRGSRNRRHQTIGH